ncbi:hypothetical protein [Streptacidiphilus carbonis]|uniref:hypothetical protein n=1 Tax=Streptacidiphilus carbonis TaxID=105422 RepID=UPI0005AA6846|nr:hypothetical protein [Streptacidiphilus carbonis]
MVAVVIAVLALAVVQWPLFSLLHRRRLRACRGLVEQALAVSAQERRVSAEEQELFRQTVARLEAVHAAAVAAVEAKWLDHARTIDDGYRESVERLRVGQAAALLKLQQQLPAPDTLRLHGEQRP